MQINTQCMLYRVLHSFVLLRQLVHSYTVAAFAYSMCDNGCPCALFWRPTMLAACPIVGAMGRPAHVTRHTFLYECLSGNKKNISLHECAGVLFHLLLTYGNNWFKNEFENEEISAFLCNVACSCTFQCCIGQ